MRMEATVFVSSEETPYICSYNEKNSCMRLTLSGDNSMSANVALYGTHRELIEYLSKGLAAVLKHSQKMTVTPEQYVDASTEETEVTA